MSTTKVLVSMTAEQVAGLDRLVEMGLYSSRSEAVRDAARSLVRQQLGSLSDLKPTRSSVELARGSREDLWSTALKRAKGDTAKAFLELKRLVEE